jgi:hypothetical protein
LQDEELAFVLTCRWRELGRVGRCRLRQCPSGRCDHADRGGNFRLLHRLFVQIERIVRINGRDAVIDDVEEAA